MYDIDALSIDLTNRDLSRLVAEHRPLLSVPADDLPLAASIEALAEMIRQNGSKPFAFRIPDDARLLAVLSRSGLAAIVSTYWRHKIAHLDLVVVSDSLPSGLVDCLSFTHVQLATMNSQSFPLLVRCRVRRRIPAIAEVLGMIVYMPAMLDAAIATN